MNGFLKAITLIASILLAGTIEVYGQTNSIDQSETTQQKTKANLKVTLRKLAIIYLGDANANSMTVLIEKFNSEGVTVDDGEFLPIDQIEKIVFIGSLWDDSIDEDKYKVRRIAASESRQTELEEQLQLTREYSRQDSWWKKDREEKCPICTCSICTLPNVPINALIWQSPSETTELKIDMPNSDAERQELLKDADQNIYIIEEILVNSPETITIEVTPVARQQ